MQDPEEVIAAAERERAAIREYYEPALEWFLDNQGLDRREDVVDRLADALDVDPDVARPVVSHLVSDEVDPVQQVAKPGDGRYVGVISYAEHDWFYAFDHYDDRDGRQRRAVCGHCIHADEITDDDDAHHYTRPPEEYDRDAAEALLAFHYERDHAGTSLPTAIRAVFGLDPQTVVAQYGDVGSITELSVGQVVRAVERLAEDSDEVDYAALDADVPSADVYPGAKLQSGTTISGNKAWHQGVVNAGSGINISTNTISTTGGGGNLVERTISGKAYTPYSTSTTKSVSINATTGNTFPYTLQIANGYDFGFLNYNGLNGIVLQTIKQGTASVTPVTSSVNVTSINANTTFTFTFTNTLNSPAGTLTLKFTAGKYV